MANDAAAAATAVAAVEFDPALLSSGGAGVDLSRFSSPSLVTQGVYRVDLYLNDRWIERRDVRVEGTPPTACVDRRLLSRIGLDHAALTPAGLDMLTLASDAAVAECMPLSALATEGRVGFDLGELRMDISVPQAALSRRPQGYVPPESWDYGIPAATLSYNAHAYHSVAGDEVSEAQYLGLTGGINLGQWRLRHRGYYARSSDQPGHYSAIGTSVSTDLTALRSSLTLGDSYTAGALFPSVSYRGFTVSSDDRMRPDAERGYAPVIRGIANSNARVEIRQAGVLISSTSVPAGPFVIDDLLPTGAYGGNLVVTLVEADGSQRTWSVPYAAMPNLLREGALKYAMTVGKLRGYTQQPSVIEATVQYGLNNTLTANTGLRLSESYEAVLIGGAANTPIGAFKLETTLSAFHRNLTQTYRGYSVEAGWAKTFPASGTSVAFTSHRYSSQGFYDLPNAMTVLELDAGAQSPVWFRPRSKQRFVLSSSTAMGNGIGVSFAGFSESYWDSLSRSTSFQAGLSKSFGRVQMTLSAIRTLPSAGVPASTQVAIGLMLPLPGSERDWATTTVSNASAGGRAAQVTLSGTRGREAELSYNLSESRSRGENAVSASASYKGSVATVGIGASAGKGTQQHSISASGGIVVANGHVAMAPQLGDTIGLIHVEGGGGMAMRSFNTAELDSAGYTVVPYLNPYTVNTVDLDVSDTPLSSHFSSTSATVTPRAGAVVLLKFEREMKTTVFLRSRTPDGRVLPFGAAVYAGANVVGSVGQAGRIHATVQDATGALRVQWGPDAEESCQVQYSRVETGAGDGIHIQDAACLPASKTPPAPLQTKPVATTTDTPLEQAPPMTAAAST